MHFAVRFPVNHNEAARANEKLLQVFQWLVEHRFERERVRIAKILTVALRVYPGKQSRDAGQQVVPEFRRQ